MLKPAIEKMLNDQINKEFFAAYLYLDMASKCEEMGRPGYGKWFRVQSEEEIEHGMKIYKYMHEQGSNIKLEAVAKPEVKEKNLLGLFQKALDHEKLVTESINKIMEAAVKNKDYATEIFLQWFVTEQLEEESSVQEIIDALKNMGDDKAGIYFLGKKLAARKE